MTPPAASSPSRRKVLRDLAVRFSSEGRTHAAKDELDEFQPALDQLIEVGALVEHGGSVRFSHESLRDFAFAEGFAESGRSLHTDLLAGGQDLSDRPMVRQVLTYLRGIDRSRYIATVEDLLGSREVRFHIRDVVFDVLRTDPQPTALDWAVLERALLTPESDDYRAAWSVLIQPAWFELVDRLGVVLRWMTSEQPSSLDLATRLLRVVQRDSPGRVAVLLAPFVPIAGEWQRRIRWIVGGLGVPPDRRYVEFLADCIAKGVFDDGDAFLDDDIWMAVHDLPSQEPTWAARLVEEYLARGSALAGEHPNLFEASVFPDSEYWAAEFVDATARHNPRGFTEVVLGPVLSVARSTAKKELPDGDGTLGGDPWESRRYSRREEFHWALFNALDRSLTTLARSKPRSFRRFVRDLSEEADIESIRYLLYRGWAANPGQFASDALAYLLREPSPFRCANATNRFGATRDLIRSLQLQLSPPQLNELEDRIAQYVPAWERSSMGRAEHRSSQWQLLDAFEESRLSDRGKALLRELRQKFGDRVPDERPFKTGAVGPPIPERAAARMKDDQWLTAIQKYERDDFSVVGETFAGGAIELARVLESETKEDPDRFARLALSFTPATHLAYIDAVLRGIADSESLIDADALFAALRHFFEMPDRPGGRWIERPLARVADQDIPPDVLAIVAWYATEAGDPESDNFESYSDTSSTFYPDSPLTAGINSVRGVAAMTLSALVWPRAERVDALAAPLNSVASDKTLAVRSCAALAVRSVMRHDVERGLDLFDRLVAIEEDLLLVQRPVEELTAFVVRHHYAAAQGVLDRMMKSNVDSVRRAGGRLAAFAAMFNEEATAPIEAALSGDVLLRVGVAEVAAANVADADFQHLLQPWLIGFFDDDDGEVRTEASGWCRAVNAESLSTLSDLLATYIESRAYAEDEDALLHVLDESPAPVSELGLRAVERFLDLRGDEIGDISKRAAASARTASKLAIRAYTSAADDSVRERALDVIDRLLAGRASGMVDLVSQFDA